MRDQDLHIKKNESFDKALVRTRLSFNFFLKTFSLENKGFGVLKKKRVFLGFFLKILSLKNKGFLDF